MPLPLAGEFGTHVEGVPSTPFFGGFGTHVPEGVPLTPFFDEFGLHVPLPGPVPMQFISLPSQPLRQPL
jgi:hypothetical protein